MHLAKLLAMLVVCMMLCSLQSAFAQTIQLPEDADRPTQRWLPLPQGDGIDLSEQAQLLKQLRDLMSSKSGTGADDSPSPKLSEQQLQEMEKALEDLREQIGKDKLPNLENIPKEWIDQALSDPIVRKQAQQLLEQYTRDRKLPSPDRTQSDSNGVPFPRRQPNDKQPNIRQPNDRQPNIRQPNDKATNQNPPTNARPNPNSNSNSTPKSKSPNSAPDKASDPADLSNPSSKGPASNDPTSKDPTSKSPASKVPNPLGQTPREKTTGQSPNGQSPNGQSPNGQSHSDGIEELPIAPNETRDGNSLREESGQPQPPFPMRPDPERIEALQELFKKLKTIEGNRPLEKQTPRNNARNPGAPNFPQGNSSSPKSNPAMRPNASSGQPNSVAPPNSRNNSSKPMTPLQERNSKGTSREPSGELPNSNPAIEPIEDPFTSNSENAKNSENANSTRSDALRTPQSKPLAPEPSYKPSGSFTERPSRIGPKTTDQTQNPWPRSPKEGSQPTSGSKSTLAPDVDVKTQLERHGLGRALQSIVEKTLKEQGESRPAKERSTGKNSNTQSNPKDNSTKKASNPAAPAVPQASKPITNNPTPQNPNAITNRNGAAASAPQSNNQNPNTSSTMSGLRDMANQFWGAIRSTPGEKNIGSSSSAPSVAGGGLGEFGFNWSGRVWLILVLLLVGLVMLFLLARKRIEQATAARVAEAELAKEILTEGIRTRADVVRAFHRFVLRRAQPVATWWNHRYVALRLTEASPQLRSVISDLASVYEHARYLPPEVALSSDEIDRVQTALKQCAACSV